MAPFILAGEVAGGGGVGSLHSWSQPITAQSSKTPRWRPTSGLRRSVCGPCAARSSLQSLPLNIPNNVSTVGAGDAGELLGEETYLSSRCCRDVVTSW